MLRTVFELNLSHKVLPGKVAVGKFDGKNPCLVAATVSDKVIWHSSQSRDDNRSPMSAASDVYVLNINQTIQSISTGCLKHGSTIEHLVIGTPSSIFVYDVQNNTDVFYREIADGANAVLVGRIGSIPHNIALAGGNCAIQGFDSHGRDAYWTVTGDNINYLSLFDLTDDGQNELIVGTEDYDITIFKDESILYEISETDVVTCLCGIAPHTFGYALKNGTVGVYHKQERIWRIKSKNVAATFVAWDVNGDGVPELVTGWTSGKIDARNIETGDVVFKDTFAYAIAAIIVCDYNMDGMDEMMVVTVEGEVRGYQRVGKEVRPNDAPLASRRDEELLRELMKKKQALLMELRSIEEHNNDWGSRTTNSYIGDDATAGIPVDTQIKTTLVLAPEDKVPCIHMSLNTSNDTIIRTAVIFAEGIFKGESFVVHTSDQDTTVTLSLKPEKDMQIDLHVKAVVGSDGRNLFHVFELTRRLPKFSMYALVPNDQVSTSGPIGRVTFTLNEKSSRLIQWFNKNFLVQYETPDPECFEATVFCLRDSSLMCMSHNLTKNEFSVATDNMDLAADILQSLVADFLGHEELHSSAHFPKEMQLLKSLVAQVDEIQSVRQQLAADIAENSARIRSLVVRSEDARLLSEFAALKQIFAEINSVNRDLVKSYSIRQKNQEDLVAALKQINVLIQKTANLRVGKPKSDLVQACRLAIRQNNLISLIKIITTGEV